MPNQIVNPPPRPRSRRRRPTPVSVSAWRLERLGYGARRAAARQIITALTGMPQPDVAAPGALRHQPSGLLARLSTGAGAGEGSAAAAPGPAPLSYRELEDNFSPALLEEQSRCAPFDLAARKQEIAVRELAGGTESSVPRAPQKPRKMTGRGGLRPRLRLHDPSEAHAGMTEALGEPRTLRRGQVEVRVYELNPAGRGAIIARLSSAEAADGEKLISQVSECDALLKRLRRHDNGEPLGVRYVIASAINSAMQRYQDRLDLQFLEARILNGGMPEIDWVIARHQDRLAREEHARSSLFQMLRETRTGLYLVNFGRVVDWRRDKMALQAAGMASEAERDMTAERTSRGQHAFVARGRGWLSAPRFGFYRHEVDRQWHQDHDQWVHLRWLFERYYEICRDQPAGRRRRGGLRQLAEELDERGQTLTPTSLSKILRDPIYVTGERPPVKVKGRLVTARPVKLIDPVSPELFAAVGELLDRHNGPNSLNPIGTHPFNGVEIRHARCMDQPNPPMLRARAYPERNTRSRFTHSSPVPACCMGKDKRVTIDEDLFTEAVVRELLRLANCADLRREWEARRKAETRPDEGKARRAQLQRERDKLSAFQRRKTELGERFAAEVAEGGGDTDVYRELIAALLEQIRRQQRIIEVEEAALKLAPRPTPILDEAQLAEADEEAQLLYRLREVLTVETPEDLDQRRRRMAVIEACLSKIIVHDAEEGVVLELFGPLAPKGAPPVGPLNAARPVFARLESPSEAVEVDEDGEVVVAEGDRYEADGTEADRYEAELVGETPPNDGLDELVGVGVLNSQSVNSSPEELTLCEWLFDPSKWDDEPRPRPNRRPLGLDAPPSWCRRVSLPTVARPRSSSKWSAERRGAHERYLSSKDPAVVVRREISRQRANAGQRARIMKSGCGGPPPTGFRRCKRDPRRLVVDEEVWPLIETIFYSLPLHGSVARLHAAMSEAGWEVGIATVYRVLSYNLYCDGIWQCRWRGEVVHEQRIPLARPIPRAIFERNREIVRSRGTLR